MTYTFLYYEIEQKYCRILTPTVEITPGQTTYTVLETDGTTDITLTITAADTGVSGLEKCNMHGQEKVKHLNILILQIQ